MLGICKTVEPDGRLLRLILTTFEWLFALAAIVWAMFKITGNNGPFNLDDFDCSHAVSARIRVGGGGC